jgi:hypothetical protein
VFGRWRVFGVWPRFSQTCLYRRDMRILRVFTGVLLTLFAFPLLAGGVGLALTAAHRGPTGVFTAAIADLETDGYAIVAPDVDRVLRREAPFARGGRTTLRLTAGGPVFLGLAPRPAVDRYLYGVPRTELTRVRLARGPLPVDARRVYGPSHVSGPPADQSFWLATGSGVLAWSPSALRGRDVALVVMNADASPGVHLGASASIDPRWLSPTAYGLLILGAALLLLGLTTLGWPTRAVEVVHVSAPPARPTTLAELPPEQAVPEPAPIRPPPPVWRPPPARPNLPWPPLNSAGGNATNLMAGS